VLPVNAKFSIVTHSRGGLVGDLLGEDVVHYPTDFSAMSDADIDLLSRRGEQLTRLLIEHYCPDL
jgi:hypothetical protein